MTHKHIWGDREATPDGAEYYCPRCGAVLVRSYPRTETELSAMAKGCYAEAIRTADGLTVTRRARLAGNIP